jgi:hypothetical protein
MGEVSTIGLDSWLLTRQRSQGIDQPNPIADFFKFALLQPHLRLVVLPV